jgi:ribosomal protein L11 methyltransferase
MATRVSRGNLLYQLTVRVPAEAEEAASATLETRFAAWPISYSEPESSFTELTLFLAADLKPTRPQLAELTVALRGLTGLGIPMAGLEVRLAPLANRNWKESWKRHFKPLPIGRRLLLRPSWSRRRASPGQAVVVLDPGLSFGTGQHPTTSFCLRELVREHNRRRQQSFLDIGTGSGILAIAAAKLGYQPVQAFDFDPESVRVASANARRNRVAGRIQFEQKDLTRLPRQSRAKYDVVCANLLADLLVAESSRILSRVKPGGLLVIAGILGREFAEVNAHFTAKGTHPLRMRTEGEWQSGSYRISV